MSAARGANAAAWWAWRAVVLLVAAGLIGAIVAAAERSRPGSTALGRAIGAASPQFALEKASDALTLHATLPKADELALARRTAVAEPLSPLPFYVLGASGHATVAATAIGAALQRDPRFRPGYRWQAVARAKVGDVGGATRALIVLATLSPTDQNLWPAIAKLTADPAARAEIKREIALGAPWRDGYLALLGASPVDRGIVFEMLQTAGKRPDAVVRAAVPGQPDDHAAFIAAMVARHDYERAYLAWVEWLPAASQDATGLVFDGGFKGRAALAPFAWALSDGVGGSTAIDPTIGLTLDYAGTDGAVLAQQMVLLAPGRYRLVTAARFDAASNDNGAPPLVWALTCVSDSHALANLPVPLDGVDRRVGGGVFAVDKTCPAQHLTLRVNSVDFAKRLSGHIRSVAIEAVTG